MGFIIACVKGAEIKVENEQVHISRDKITQIPPPILASKQMNQEESEEWETRFKGATQNGDIIWVVGYTLGLDGPTLDGVVVETIPNGIVILSQPEFQIEHSDEEE